MKKERFDPYSNYYYKLDKKKKRNVKLLTIFFVIFSLTIVIFFSFSFSNFLTVAKIVNINSNFICDEKNLYAISLKTTNKLSEAEQEKESIKKQGGAGYVLNLETNTYEVITSIYPSEKDAKTVKSNLVHNNIESKIIKLNLPAFNFKVNLSTKSTKILSKGINIFYLNYKSLYDLSLNFDSKKIDVTKLKINLNNLLNDNKQIINEYNSHFKNSSNIYLLYVKIYLNRVNEIITNLLNKDESLNLSSEVKYAYCSILNIYLDLYNEMI